MRLFVAASIPEDVRRSVADSVGRVKSRVPVAGWVRPESMHVTFAFIGEQSESIVPVIAHALDEAAHDLRCFSARLRGCGFFPSAKRPRVGWIGIEQEAPMKEISTKVRASLQQASVPFDPKPFSPHLTIARMRETWRAADAASLALLLGGFESREFEIEEVVLYESRSGAGTKYARLHVARLQRS